MRKVIVPTIQNVGRSARVSGVPASLVCETNGTPRGQSRDPLLHVIQLMLPPLSALSTRLSCALAPAAFSWIVASFLGATAFVPSAGAADELLLGNVTGEQDFPSVLVMETGGYVVFEDNRVGSGKDGRGMSAVLLDSSWRAAGESFRVNQVSLGKHERPQIVALGGGKALALWEVRQGAKAGMYGRVLGTNGASAAGDLLLNVPTTKATIKQTVKWAAHYRGKWKTRTHKFKDIISNTREQAGAVAAASLPDGGAVLVYQAIRRSETNSWTLVDETYVSRGKFLTNAVLRPTKATEDWMFDIFMQRLDANGAKVGAEILVNQYANYNQRTPAVAVLENGNLAVVWVCEYPASSDWRANFRVDLMGRIFNPQGEPVGDEFSVAASDSVAQANPVVIGAVGGGFTVLWSQQEGAVSRNWDVYGRVFGLDGSAAGSAFRVNSHTTGDQFAPRAASQGGRQLVVWTSVGQDGSREGVYGRFLENGVIDGEEFRINDTTASRQFHPSLAPDGAGRALVVWAGFSGATGFDLFRRIMPLGGTE